ncbi:MAG TPA: helix-turn-helix domain-containing protein [Gemmatimonadaceae bacterium]|jgi:AraC-like DNA-binding protein
MRLLIAVPAYRLARVRDVAPSGCAATIVARLDRLDTAMRAASADIAIFDPLLDQPLDAAKLIQTVRSHPCAQWLLYTQLRPDTARLLLDLGGAGVRTAVFAGVDDSTDHMRSVLGELVRESVTQRAQARLMALLAPLPCRLRVAVEHCMSDDDARIDVSILAARACMTRRTVERHFMRAGLPTPKIILRAARVLTAYRLLYDGTRTCNGVAKILGYGKVSTLRAHLKRTFGVHARALQHAPTPEIAIEALLDQPETRTGRGAAHVPPAAALR